MSLLQAYFYLISNLKRKMNKLILFLTKQIHHKNDKEIETIRKICFLFNHLRIQTLIVQTSILSHKNRGQYTLRMNLSD